MPHQTPVFLAARLLIEVLEQVPNSHHLYLITKTKLSSEAVGYGDDRSQSLKEAYLFVYWRRSKTFSMTSNL